MDFQSMKRKELQSLCKKHNLPANSTNQAMVHALSSLLKVEQVDKKARRGRSCLKRSVETAADDGAEILKNDKVKKVRFSPDEEFYEFEASTTGRYPLRNRYATGRPAMVSRKVKKQEISAGEAIGNSDRLVAGDIIPVRSLRSREVVSVCGGPISRIQVEVGDSGTKEENDPGKTSKNVVGDDCFLNNMMQTRSRKKRNGNPKESGEQSDNEAVKKSLRRSKRTSLAVDEMAESDHSNRCDEGARKTRRAKAGESLKKDEVLNEEFGLSRTRSQMQGKEESVKVGKEDLEEVHEKFKAENWAGGKGANPSIRNARALAEKAVIKNLDLLGSDVDGHKNNKNLRKTRSMTVSEKPKKSEEVEEEVCVPKNSMLTRSKKQKHDGSAGGDEILVDSELHSAFCDKIWTDDRTECKRVQHRSKCNARELHEIAADKNTAMESLQAIGMDRNKSYRRTRKNNSMVGSENSKNDGEVGREVVLARNLRQTRSQKLKTNKLKEHEEVVMVSDEVCRVLSGRISAKAGPVDEGMRQHKSKTQVFDEMVWENTKSNGSKGLDAGQCKHDRSIRKTRSSVAIESLKNNEKVEREVDSSKDPMQPITKRSTSVSEGLNSDGKLGRGVGVSKRSRFIRTHEMKNDKQTVDEEIMNPGEVLNKDCNVERTGMVVDRMTAEDPQVDGMGGMAVASLNQSLKKGILAEEALEGEDGNGTKGGAACVLNEHAKVFAIEELPKRPRHNSCEASTLSKFHSGSDEITTNEGSAFVKMTSDAKGGNGHDIGYGECSRRVEQGTPVHAVCVSCNGSKVSGDETVGMQMEDVVLQANNPAYDCKVGDDDNKANEGLKRSESHTGEEKCSKFTIDSSVPSCENSDEAVPKLVLHEDAVLSAELEECIEEAGSLSASNTDNIKKELASGQKSCGKKGFFKANMPSKEWSSKESNREVPPVTPVLTNTVLSKFKTMVLVGDSHSADLMNIEAKDCVGNMSIENEMADQQRGGEQLSGSTNFISNHVSLVVYPDGGFHAERGFMPEKQIMEADKDGLAFRSHEEVQNSFRLKSKLSGNEMVIPKLMNPMCEAVETPRGPHLDKMDIVAKEMTEEAFLASNEASVIQDVAAGFVAATTSDFTLTSSLDAKPINAVEFLELKATVATSACKHDMHAELSPGRNVDIIVHHDCSGGVELEESQKVNKMVAAHREPGVKHSSPIEGYQGNFNSKITWNASEAHDGKDPKSSNSKNVEKYIEDDEFAEAADNKPTIKYRTEDSEKNGVLQTDPGKINPASTESHVSNRNEEAVSETFEERHVESDISFKKQNQTIVKEKTTGFDWKSSCQSFHECMEEKGKESVEPIIPSDITKAIDQIEDNVVLMAVSQSANHKSNVKGSFGNSTVAEEMGCGCFGAVQPLDEGKFVVLNATMTVDSDMGIGPDNELGHCDNGKDGAYTESLGRGKASFSQKNVVLEANQIAISKGMEGMRQADVSTEGLGYQEMGSVGVKGNTEEAILPCSDASNIQEIAVRAETASKITESISSDQVFVHAVQVTDSRGTDENSLFCDPDMGAKGFSPGRVICTAMQLNCDGIPEPSDTQKVNHSTSGVKHFSSIQAIRNQDEDLLSSLPIDSVDFSWKETLLVCDSENHEGPHRDYHEWFDHEIDDKEFSKKARVKEFSEQAGVNHSNSGKVDNQNIEVNDTSNKNFEVLKEQLEDRYRIELGTAEAFSQKLDPNGSEERSDDNEVNSVVLEEFKDSVSSIVMNSAYWSLKGKELKVDSEEIAEEKRNIETGGCGDSLDPGAIMAVGPDMVIDPDSELGHCENGNESFFGEIEECGKDGAYTGSFGRGKASFGLKKVALDANGIAISKRMEGMCQADIGTEGGYQGKGSVVIKGSTAEAIVPCNDASSVPEIAIRTEAATENTESVSSDRVLVHAVQVTDSRGMNGNSLACNLDMGTKGFSPERVVGTAIQLKCDGIPEPSDTQKVNHSTSGSKHFSSIRAIQNQVEDLLSSLPIDSVDFSWKETLLVCDSENHEGSHHDYHEWFDHEIDDKEFSKKARVKEFSEVAGVTHSNSGQFDNQNIEANTAYNKKFEVMTEQLEDRYTLELGTADTISRKLDSSSSEERRNANEVKNTVLEEFNDSAESIVSNSASWILKGKEMKVDSEEIAEENRNIETVEETGGCGDGLDEPADEKENKVILMDECGSEFEQFVVVSLAESAKQLSGTAEIVCDANDTEKSLATNEFGYIVSEEIEDATLPIANGLADDLECLQVKGKSEETTEKKRNVENTKEADACMYIIKTINKEENSVILTDKYGRTVEQFVAAAPVELKEPPELDGTTATGEKSISPSDGPDSTDNTPRGSKDSGFPYRHNISAEKQEEGSSQVANICASEKKFASVEDNLYCGCDVVTDSRNPIKKSSEFQVEDLNINSCTMKTQEGAGRSKTKSLFEELLEASDRAKITQVPSELNCKAQVSSIYPLEKNNGRGHLEIIKTKEFDESFQEVIGSMGSEEVMHDEENEIEGEFVYGCSTGYVVGMEAENTNDSEYAKSEEEKLSCEAFEVADTKAMADMNAEKVNHLECPQAALMKSDKPSAAPEVVERAFGLICEEESTSKQLISVAESEEVTAPYLESVEIDAVNSHKEPDATKGPEKDECDDAAKATKRRNSSLSMQSKLIDELKCQPIAAEIKENMPVMKEKANTHHEVKSATPLRRRALENLQSSERTRNEKSRVFNC